MPYSPAAAPSIPFTQLPPAIPSLAEAAAFADQLFPIPQAVRDSRAAMARGASAQQIAGILATDQIMAAAVVRLANSAAFRGRSTIRDLSQAVARVGNKQLEECLLALSALPKGKQNPTVARLTKRIVTVGAACRVLASYQTSIEVGTALMTGLFMDIGQVLLAHGWEHEYKALVFDEPSNENHAYDVTIEEKDWLGFDHVAVSVAVLESWKLDKEAIEGVRYSHNLIGAMADGGPLATVASAILGLAARIGRALHDEIPKDWIAPDVLSDSSENAVLRLDEDVIKQLVEEVQREAFQLGGVFGV